MLVSWKGWHAMQVGQMGALVEIVRTCEKGLLDITVGVELVNRKFIYRVRGTKHRLYTY